MISTRIQPLTESLINLRFADLDQRTVARSRAVLMDTLAVLHYGAREPALGRLAARAPAAGGATTPVLPGATTSPDWAAFLNATSAVWNELDEGVRGAGHPGAHVVAAALATAQAAQASGNTLLTAVVAGYELQARIGAHFELSADVHPHGSLGAASAALAAAIALDLSPTQREASVAIAAGLVNASLWRACTDGATIRHVSAGQGARTGVMAAFLAESGITPAATALETVFGRVLGRTRLAEADALGPQWAIHRGYVKRWPACAFTHTALDLADTLRRELGDTTVVTGIDVRVPRVGTLVAAQHDSTELGTRFSIPTLVAGILSGADLLRDFDSMRTSPSVQALAAAVRVHEDPLLTARWPKNMAAAITITLRCGRKLHAQADDPWQPAAATFPTYVVEKACRLLGHEPADALHRAIKRLNGKPLPADLVQHPDN